ncbi:MAG: transglutaminase domain-containing protein, partial [Chitinophagaceae bacterium]|nr:transglutaminase domain-containing protein [Chitinophagaceae bacterium]
TMGVWLLFVVVSGLSFFIYRERLRLVVPTLVLYMLGAFLFSFKRFHGQQEFDAFYQQGIWELILLVAFVAFLFGASLQRSRLLVYSYVALFLYALIQRVYLYNVLAFDTLVTEFIVQFALLIYFVWAYETWRSADFSLPTIRGRLLLRGGSGFLVYVIYLIGFVFIQQEYIKQRINKATTLEQSIPETLEQDKEGRLKNKQFMQLAESNPNSKQDSVPLFCAHIQFSIDGGQTQHPLYLTTNHFTKFDTTTETFERDIATNMNDEFAPSIDTIPMFHTYVDSGLFQRYDTLKYHATVETEIYIKNLSKLAVIAPSSAYGIQPFPLHESFRNEYNFSYKTYSSVSAINSAYFIYNANDPYLQIMQEMRFATLRKAPPVTQLPADFLRYYTSFPNQGQYRPIKALADSLQLGKSTDIDKIIAVRDFFLQTDTFGNPLFRYSDNPGIPGLPGASKILHFLFESRDGYCAYYAAATVALLRCMGLPARVVTGFMTVDRSDKHEGWYWYYADQSHAWVQVYFPNYGWIDFDTTLGNDDAQEAPRPDATPPIEAEAGTLVFSGQIESVDVSRKRINVHVNRMLWGRMPISTIDTSILFDVSRAKIQQDTLQLGFNDLTAGQTLSLVSYNSMYENRNQSTQWQSAFNTWLQPLAMDAIYIQGTKMKNSVQPNKAYDVSSVEFYLILTLVLVGLILIFLLLWPWLTYRYWRWCSHHKNASLKTWYIYLMYCSYLENKVPGNRSIRLFIMNEFDKDQASIFLRFISFYWEACYSPNGISSIKKNEALLLAYQLEHSFIKQHGGLSAFKRWFNWPMFILFRQTYFNHKKM